MCGCLGLLIDKIVAGAPTVSTEVMTALSALLGPFSVAGPFAAAKQGRLHVAAPDSAQRTSLCTRAVRVNIAAARLKDRVPTPSSARKVQGSRALEAARGHGDAAQRSLYRSRALAVLYRMGRLMCKAATTAAVAAHNAAATAAAASNGTSKGSAAAAAAAGPVRTGVTCLLVAKQMCCCSGLQPSLALLCYTCSWPRGMKLKRAASSGLLQVSCCLLWQKHARLLLAVLLSHLPPASSSNKAADQQVQAVRTAGLCQKSWNCWDLAAALKALLACKSQGSLRAMCLWQLLECPCGARQGACWCGSCERVNLCTMLRSLFDPLFACIVQHGGTR